MAKSPGKQAFLRGQIITANRRMFSLDIVDTDRFLDMPSSTQALYFHLGMRADDDGFVSSPRKIVALANCGDDDMKLLIAKGYIIPFESGVCVISDWKSNNFLRSDRYRPTRFKQELSELQLSDGHYQLQDGIPMVYQTVDKRYPQDRLGKDRIEEDKESMAGKPPRTRSKFVPPTIDEVKAYCTERGNGIDAQRFVDFYTANGWTQGKGKPIKDWRAAVRTWEGREQNKPNIRTPNEYYDYDGGESL